MESKSIRCHGGGSGKGREGKGRGGGLVVDAGEED